MISSKNRTDYCSVYYDRIYLQYTIKNEIKAATFCGVNMAYLLEVTKASSVLTSKEHFESVEWTNAN